MSIDTVRLSHADRAIRRRRIAKAVADGREPAKVAGDEKVSIKTVYDACRAAGVTAEAETLPGSPTRLYAIIGLLMSTTDTMANVAARVGCSRQRVQQICANLEAVGVIRPYHERGGA
jgi:hypothetical protein